jgi:hypothetical protein
MQQQVSMKLCFSTKVATTKVAWSCSFLLILNYTIVPWNKKVIFKDLAMCSWSTQIPDCLFHSLRCWVFCTKCPPSSSYLAQSMHIMKNNLVKSLCNRWTSWGSTLCNACAIYGYRGEESPCAILVQICGHREEAPCAMLVQSMDIMKKNHLVQSLCKYVDIVKKHLVKSLCNLWTSWRRVTLCNLWTSWRIHFQFAGLYMCDAEIGVSCKEELLESWWWCYQFPC